MEANKTYVVHAIVAADEEVYEWCWSEIAEAMFDTADVDL